MSTVDGDYSSPSEARLGAYLEEVSENPPQTDAALVKRVTRRARWQQSVRAPLQVAGMLAAAVLDGIVGVLGGTRRNGR